MKKEYNIYSSPQMSTVEKLEETNKQLELNKKLLNNVLNLESQGLRVFKTSYNLVNLTNEDLIVLNLNDGVYYRIDILELFTDPEDTINSDMTQEYTKILNYIDLDFVLNHNNNMLNTNILDFKDVPLYQIKGME